MPIFRKIKPSSIGTPFKVDYEYLLMWLNSSGGVRQFYFSSTDSEQQSSFKSIVIDSDSGYRSVPNIQDRIRKITSKSMSREMFDYVDTIFETNKIYLVDKDETLTSIAISSGKKITNTDTKDFEIKITIMLQEPDLMNV